MRLILMDTEKRTVKNMKTPDNAFLYGKEFRELQYGDL